MEHLKNFFSNYRMVTYFTIAFFIKSLILLLDLNFNALSPIYYLASIIFGALFFAPALFLAPKNRRIYVVTISFFISLVFFADVVYYRYYSGVPSFSSIVLAPQLSQVSESIFRLAKVRDALLFFDIIIFFLLQKMLFKVREDREHHFLLKFSYLGLFLLTTALVVLVDYKDTLPRFLNSVYESKLVAQRYGVFGSHLFDGIRLLYRNQVKLTDAERVQALDWTAQNVAGPLEKNDKTGIAKNKNVILIQVESLQQFVIGKRVEGKELTPNLNRFLRESTGFTNNHFIVGLGNTSDADIAVNTSLYPLTDAAIAVRYPKNDFSSLPKELSEEGYTANAYHGFYRDFWNRNKTFDSLGYQDFYAKDNYKEGKIIGMGLSDYDFLTQTVEKVKEQEGLSLDYLITLSSHHPFSLNDEDKVINLKRENYTDEVYRYYNLVAYTDAALGQFLEDLKKENKYDDTLIVLYGDHAANLGDLTNLKTIKSIGLDVSKTKDYLDYIKVPLIIKLPGQISPEQKTRLTSNLDIMPTILNLVDAKVESPMFGSDVFSKKTPFFASLALQNRSFATDGKKYFCTNSKGHPEKPPACFRLKEKKNDYLKYSERLIKNNLFGELTSYLARNLVENGLK